MSNSPLTYQTIIIGLENKTNQLNAILTGLNRVPKVQLKVANNLHISAIINAIPTRREERKREEEKKKGEDINK